MKREVLGARHPSTLTTMNNLAGLLKDMGQNTEALALLRELHAAQPPYAAAVLADIQTLEAL